MGKKMTSLDFYYLWAWDESQYDAQAREYAFYLFILGYSLILRFLSEYSNL